MSGGEGRPERPRHGGARLPRPPVPRTGTGAPSPHRAVSSDDLQRVMVGAWPAMETARLGDWLLRAARGFTNRANSAMTAGSPGLPLPAAVDAVESWYAERGLPSNLAVAGPVGFDPREHPLVAELLARGYTPRVPTRTMTADVRAVSDSAAVAAGAAELRLWTSEDLSDAWLRAYRGYRTVDEEAARAVLTGSAAQDLATATGPDGAVVGIGRLGVAAGWGGVAAMWVDPAARRRGVASAVLGTLAARARARGIRSLHLQTDTDNRAALALYERHGFTAHHDYVNVHRDRRG